jgi:hypothetical protein
LLGLTTRNTQHTTHIHTTHIHTHAHAHSFENIQHWRQQIALYASTIDIVLLIGTKVRTSPVTPLSGTCSCSDLPRLVLLQVDAAAEERRVTPEEGQALAETMRAQFAETR